jgi:RHS repeat-associated protein
MMKSDGTVSAAYEYSPFGESLRHDGAYAATNPFRFSTKYTDDESGLVYYGHRYYSPSLGRFINRDPGGTAGGINLYAFVGNNPVNSFDYLGLLLLTEEQIAFAKLSPAEQARQQLLYDTFHFNLGDGVDPIQAQIDAFARYSSSISGVSATGSDMVGVEAFTDKSNESAAAMNTYYNAVPGSWSALSIGSAGDTGYYVDGSAASGGFTISDKSTGEIVVQAARNQQTGEWRDFANSYDGVSLSDSNVGDFNLVTGKMNSNLDAGYGPMPRQGNVSDSFETVSTAKDIVDNAIGVTGLAAGKATIGTNGHFYPNGWNGNRYVSTESLSEATKAFGQFTVALGAIFDAYKVHTGQESVGKAILNTGVGVGTLALPPPFDVGLGVGYFIIENPQSMIHAEMQTGTALLNGDILSPLGPF